MPPTTSSDSEALQKLYGQNLELAVKNKTLSLLRQLYQISILSLERGPLAFKIVETVRAALELEIVGIFVLDEKSRDLVPLKFNLSERLQKVENDSKTSLEECVIPKSKDNSFFRKIFDKTPAHTENISDVWHGLIPDLALQAFAETAHVKTLSAYPLVIDENIIGVLLIGLNRPYETLSQFEKDSLTSLVDVTAIALDRARLYEELKIANAKLTEANDQQVVLIHFITHQVKGFFTKSKYIFSAMLGGDYGLLSKDIQEIATEGLASDTSGINMVQEILNAANVRKGTVAYDMKKIDIRPIVEEAVKNLKPSATVKKLELSFSDGTDTFITTGDASQLEHVFKNVIDNSIKYTPAGTISVGLEKKNGLILFSVKDTGVGLTDEDKARLFTEGGHGKDSQKINTDSTGYGLFIVKNIVEAHKGHIWAESEGTNKGSQFYVELPLAEA